jgi:hypothetical protein
MSLGMGFSGHVIRNKQFVQLHLRDGGRVDGRTIWRAWYRDLTGEQVADVPVQFPPGISDHIEAALLAHWAASGGVELVSKTDPGGGLPVEVADISREQAVAFLNRKAPAAERMAALLRVAAAAHVEGVELTALAAVISTLGQPESGHVALERLRELGLLSFDEADHWSRAKVSLVGDWQDVVVAADRLDQLAKAL